MPPHSRLNDLRGMP